MKSAHRAIAAAHREAPAYGVAAHDRFDSDQARRQVFRAPRRLACSGGDRDRFAHDARACRSCPLP